jgi:hypothetical protein
VADQGLSVCGTSHFSEQEELVQIADTEKRIIATVKLAEKNRMATVNFYRKTTKEARVEN